jgi:dienelactone hydrolase
VSFTLSTGAEGRWTGEPGPCAVVCVDGGTAAEVPGTWSASVEWLVRRLAGSLPGLAFLEVRYRLKSWRRLELCVQDGGAALEAAREAGAERLAVLAFSMGGAVAVRNAAADPSVMSIVGVNPWLPAQLELEPLRGRRLAIVHGSLDAPLPGIPGVRPSMSMAAFTRAREAGVEARREVVSGGLHAVALRRPGGGLLALPRAQRYAAFVEAELERFCA